MARNYLGANLSMDGATLNGTGGGTSPGVVCDGVTQVGAAIQTLLDTVPVGTKVVLPGGNCMINQTYISRSIALQGAGQDNTYIKQTVTDIPVLIISTLNVHVTGMTIMHSSNPQIGGDGLIVRKPDGHSLNGIFLNDVWPRGTTGALSWAV